MNNEFQNKTDEELLDIKGREENTDVATSQYQSASRELESRDRKKFINIPWYRNWWMIYITYPLLGVLIGSVVTILTNNQNACASRPSAVAFDQAPQNEF